MRIISKSNQVPKYTKYEYLIFTLCGFIVFSPLSSKITINILHLPLALPELLFLPFYFFLKNRINFSLHKNTFILGLIIILFLLAISLIYNHWKLYSIISTFRGYFYILICFSVFKNKKVESIMFILLLSVGSLFGWLVDSILFLKHIANNTTNSLAVYGNMITLCLAISIPIIFKKNKYIIITFISGIVLSISSGTRRQVLVFVLTFILSFILTIRISLKNLAKSFFVFLTAVSFLLFLLPKVELYLLELSPILHYRIFTKTETLLKGEVSSSDKIRTNAFVDFNNSIEKNIFPRGFVSKRTMNDEGASVYMDSPYYELFYTFSIGGVFLIFIITCKYLLFHIKNYLYKDIRESGVCIVTIFIITILFFIEGSFLNFNFTTPITGFALGRIFSKRNLAF